REIIACLIAFILEIDIDTVVAFFFHQRRDLVFERDAGLLVAENAVEKLSIARHDGRNNAYALFLRFSYERLPGLLVERAIVGERTVLFERIDERIYLRELVEVRERVRCSRRRSPIRYPARHFK